MFGFARKLFAAPGARAGQPVTLNADEKAIVLRFARGEGLLDEVVAIHRKYIPLIGVRGNVWQCFLAEVDTPAPDLSERRRCREKLLDLVEQNRA